MSTSEDRGHEPLYKPQVAPPRHRGGGYQIRGVARNTKTGQSYSSKVIVVSDEAIMGRPQNSSQGSHGRYTSDSSQIWREICQVMDEVEVDLIKVQMLADLELQVEQSPEILLGVSIVRNQAIYLRFCQRRQEDEDRLKRGTTNMMANIDAQFETDEAYENYNDLYDEQVEYLNN